MATALDDRHAWDDFLRALVEFPHPVRILPIQPRLVIGRYIDRTLELMSPFEVCCVEVRVADHDSFQSAFLVDEVDGLLVQKGDKVPEYVAVGCLE